MRFCVRFLPFFVLFIVLGPAFALAQKPVRVHFEGGAGIEEDTILFSEIHSEDVLGKAAIGREAAQWSFPIDRTLTVRAELKRKGSTCLLIWEAGKDVLIKMVGDTLKPANLADSLFTALWPSTNAFVGKEMGRLFRLPFMKKASTPSLQFGKARQKRIDSFKDQLSKTEYQILSHWNHARIYAFLFYAGRIQLQLPPQHPFFRYTEDISPEATYAYTFPTNLLYKYEIEYLQKTDSLESLAAFLKEIEAQTPDQDLSDYLKVIYLKELTEFPSYWRPHQQLFNALTLEAALKAEAQNPYYDLLSRSANAFLQTSAGEPAPDFWALDWDGDSIRLSDWKGKVVFLDVWASWCMPCIQQRPFVLELAKKYQGKDVVISMVNFDRSEQTWNSYVQRTNPERLGQEVFVPDNFQSDFAEHFNVHFIPRYILISPEGKIVNGNTEEPSESLIHQIDRLLEKTD